MRSVIRARFVTLIAAVSTLAAVAACGDSRVRQLDVGMSKDSMLKILAADAPAGDTLPFVYKHTQYLADGQIFDLYFYDPQNREPLTNPEVTDNELTPLVVIDGKLAGTGWGYMDQVTDKYRLPARSTTP